jgi:transposase
MAVFRIALTEDEQRVVNAERDSHRDAHIRRKMLIVWLLHCGLTRSKAAKTAGLSRPTVQRHVLAYRTGGLDRLRRWGIRGPVSDLVAHASVIREALTHRPVRTAAEGAEQIERRTGLKRRPTQIRQFLRTELGFRRRRTRVILARPRETYRITSESKSTSWTPSCSPDSTRPWPDRGTSSSWTRLTSCSGVSGFVCGR